MNHGRSDSQTLSELRRGLLSSRSAKQQQTRSPPPKKRTPAQVAQARMAWKLRLQKDDRQLNSGEKVNEHAAYRSTSPRHSQVLTSTQRSIALVLIIRSSQCATA